MNFKYSSTLFICLILAVYLSLSSAKSIEKKTINTFGSRFVDLTGLSDWFNANIIKPVNDATSNALDALNNNQIFMDFVYKPITSAASWTSDKLAQGYNWAITSIINKNETTHEIDPCEYDCFKR